MPGSSGVRVRGQLVVLDARAIGERRQTRWRHGRGTLPSRSCLVSRELSGGWQNAIDCSHQSGGCRRAHGVEQHRRTRSRRDEELGVSVTAGIDYLTGGATSADGDAWE